MGRDEGTEEWYRTKESTEVSASLTARLQPRYCNSLPNLVHVLRLSQQWCSVLELNFDDLSVTALRTSHQVVVSTDICKFSLGEFCHRLDTHTPVQKG